MCCRGVAAPAVCTNACQACSQEDSPRQALCRWVSFSNTRHGRVCLLADGVFIASCWFLYSFKYVKCDVTLSAGQPGRAAAVRDKQPVQRVGLAVLPGHGQEGQLHAAGEAPPNRANLTGMRLRSSVRAGQLHAAAKAPPVGLVSRQLSHLSTVCSRQHIDLTHPDFVWSFALLCFALLCFALLCFALLCFALLCFALLCFALLCFALLCFALLCLCSTKLSLC